MHGSGGNRLRWPELPAPVHDAVAGILGSPVVRAVSQSGGFSPGAADRVVAADGTRAFVKAVSAAQNEESPRMQEREARITAALPAAVPAPGFRGARWVGDWHVLVLEEVPGRQPRLPWRADDLAPVVAALERLAATATPCPVPDLPTAREALTGQLPADALDLLTGDTLVHLDLRADNVLLTAAGAVLVDWPHACVGPPWLDLLALLFEVDRLGGQDLAEATLRTSPLTRDVDPGVLTTVLSGFSAFFLGRAALPPPPGLPTLREFQRVQGEALTGWVRRRAAARG
ncbi:phosphotransferase family protein [Kineococcus sp. SYSU DK002]|uniref:phosphotransferase family protein n=1 Tax=Kineococcus sp. SYSU DK002 TaxID=3383123 RepID=UPI003D7E35DF